MAASERGMSGPRLARRAVWRSEAMALVYHEILLNALVGEFKAFALRVTALRRLQRA